MAGNTIFTTVDVPNVKRSRFDLSHEIKGTYRFGKLHPIGAWEVLPKDSFSVSSEVFLRFQPMLAPIMHQVDVYVHWWFVPNRLIYEDWENFITGGPDGNWGSKADVQLNPLHCPPYYLTSSIGSAYSTYCVKKTLWDYLGLPPLKNTPNSANALKISALPFRAYAKIYNEWYRDENLVPEIPIPLGGGNVTTSEFNNGLLSVLRTRAWEKDYFTSALPFAYKGKAMELTLSSTNAPIVFNGSPGNQQEITPTGASSAIGARADGTLIDVNTNQPVNILPNGTLEANLSNINIATINEMRTAFQVQKFLERNARAGNRYVENLLAHFGVRSSDARLQRPEYLGGGKANVIISESLQQSSFKEDANGDIISPQGNMSGHAIAVGKSNRFKAFFEEHGWVIGLMSIMPRTSYQQGVSRQWTRQDKYDYAWPLFAHLGEQEVYNYEIFNAGRTTDNPYGTFGYQGRYNEYRYFPSKVVGDLRDDFSFWHMGRIFSNTPSLNQDFIECKDASLNSIFPVVKGEENDDKIIADIYHSVVASRPLPFRPDPGLIDHF